MDDLRSQWIKEISDECLEAVAMGIDLRGICIYPIIERPDWDDLNHSHKSGLWDVDGFKNRIPHEDSLQMLNYYIEVFSQVFPEFQNQNK